MAAASFRKITRTGRSPDHGSGYAAVFYRMEHVMHASFPPYSKTAATPAPAAPVGAVSAFEAKLRTLKHYLYHAGLLADELLVLEAPTQAASVAEVMPGDKL